MGSNKGQKDFEDGNVTKEAAGVSTSYLLIKM